jgi:hypothetical protein
MIESINMLQSDHCHAGFDRHRLSIGSDPMLWAQSVLGLVRQAPKEDWFFPDEIPVSICPNFVLHDMVSA